MKNDVFGFFRNNLGLGEDDAQQIYGSFLESFGDVAGDLRNLKSFDDFAEIRRITHNIIGFSQNVGAFDLFELGSSLNASAKAEDVASCEKFANEILALHEAYLNE